MKAIDIINLGWCQVCDDTYMFGKYPTNRYVMIVRGSKVTIKQFLSDTTTMRFLGTAKIFDQDGLKNFMKQLGIIPEPSFTHEDIISLGWEELYVHQKPVKRFIFGQNHVEHYQMEVNWISGVAWVEIKRVQGLCAVAFSGITIYQGYVHSIVEMRNVMAMAMNIGVYSPKKVTCGIFPWVIEILQEQKEQEIKRDQYIKSITRKYKDEVEEILRKASEREPIEFDLTTVGEIGIKQPVPVVTRMKGGGFQINADYAEIITYKDGEFTIKLKDK